MAEEAEGRPPSFRRGRSPEGRAQEPGTEGRGHHERVSNTGEAGSGCVGNKPGGAAVELEKMERRT